MTTATRRRFKLEFDKKKVLSQGFPSAEWKKRYPTVFRIFKPGGGRAPDRIKQVVSVTTLSEAHRPIFDLAAIQNAQVLPDGSIRFPFQLGTSDPTRLHQYLSNPKRPPITLRIQVLNTQDELREGDVDVEIEDPAPFLSLIRQTNWSESHPKIRDQRLVLDTFLGGGIKCESALYKHDPNATKTAYYSKKLDELVEIENVSDYTTGNSQHFSANRFEFRTPQDHRYYPKLQGIWFFAQSQRVIIGSNVDGNTDPAKDVVENAGRLRVKRMKAPQAVNEPYEVAVDYRPAKQAIVQVTVTLHEYKGETFEYDPIEAPVNGEKVEISCPKLPQNAKATFTWQVVEDRSPQRVSEPNSGFQLTPPKDPVDLQAGVSKPGKKCLIANIEIVKDAITTADPLELDLALPLYIEGTNIVRGGETKYQIDTRVPEPKHYDLHLKEYNPDKQDFDDLSDRNEQLLMTVSAGAPPFTLHRGEVIEDSVREDPERFALQADRVVIGIEGSELLKGQLEISRDPKAKKKTPENDPVRAELEFLPLPTATVAFQVFLDDWPDPNAPAWPEEGWAEVEVNGEKEIWLHFPGLPRETRGRVTWKVLPKPPKPFERGGFHIDSPQTSDLRSYDRENCAGVEIAIAKTPITPGGSIRVVGPDTNLEGFRVEVGKIGWKSKELLLEHGNPEYADLFNKLRMHGGATLEIPVVGTYQSPKKLAEFDRVKIRHAFARLPGSGSAGTSKSASGDSALVDIKGGGPTVKLRPQTLDPDGTSRKWFEDLDFKVDRLAQKMRGKGVLRNLQVDGHIMGHFQRFQKGYWDEYQDWTEEKLRETEEKRQIALRQLTTLCKYCQLCKPYYNHFRHLRKDAAANFVTIMFVLIIDGLLWIFSIFGKLAGKGAKEAVEASVKEQAEREGRERFLQKALKGLRERFKHFDDLIEATEKRLADLKTVIEAANRKIFELGEAIKKHDIELTRLTKIFEAAEEKVQNILHRLLPPAKKEVAEATEALGVAQTKKKGPGGSPGRAHGGGREACRGGRSASSQKR